MRTQYLNNFKKFCFIDASTPIFVVHFESPFKFMLQFSS